MGPKTLSGCPPNPGSCTLGGFFRSADLSSMVGEDEDSEDETHSAASPYGSGMIITAAGATVNLVAGILCYGCPCRFFIRSCIDCRLRFYPESDFDNAYGELSDDEYSLFKRERRASRRRQDNKGRKGVSISATK